jgi:hypothetical protein
MEDSSSHECHCCQCPPWWVTMGFIPPLQNKNPYIPVTGGVPTEPDPRTGGPVDPRTVPPRVPNPTNPVLDLLNPSGPLNPLSPLMGIWKTLFG